MYWLYLNDTFIPIEEEIELCEDPYEFFNKNIHIIRKALGDNVKILDIAHYCTYYNGKELLVEYLIKILREDTITERGVISIKILYTENPTKLLENYYKKEKEICKPDKEKLDQIYDLSSS